MTDITFEEAKRFYDITRATLEDLAKRNGVKDLNRYYELTDFDTSTAYGQLIADLEKKGKKANRVFAQMAFHAQNRYLLSNIINFEQNTERLKMALCEFDPDEFLSNYRDHKEELIKALRPDGQDNAEGSGQNKEKNSENGKRNLISEYADTLISCAEYIKGLSDKHKDDIVDDLFECYTEKCAGNIREFIECFMDKDKKDKKARKGFGVALTCDFLKELDVRFNFLCKPDGHIKDVMNALLHRDRDVDGNKNYYRTQAREYECIEEMRDLVEKINAGLNENEKITVYKLDRMIWLTCSGNFYLDTARSDKKKYLKAVEDLKETKAEK